MASNPPMVGAATLMSAQASANCPTVTVPLGAQPPSGSSPRRQWRIHQPVWIWMPFQPRCSRPPAAASPPSTGTSIQLFAGGPVAWFLPSVTQGNPAASRAPAEFKFHCQMLEDLVIGAEELGNGLDVGRPRRLDTGQVHLPVNVPGGMLALNALVLPVFPGRAVKAALDESQAVASVRGDDMGPKVLPDRTRYERWRSEGWCHKRGWCEGRIRNRGRRWESRQQWRRGNALGRGRMPRLDLGNLGLLRR